MWKTATPQLVPNELSENECPLDLPQVSRHLLEF